jgi:hypothetical protein
MIKRETIKEIIKVGVKEEQNQQNKGRDRKNKYNQHSSPENWHSTTVVHS